MMRQRKRIALEKGTGEKIQRQRGGGEPLVAQPHSDPTQGL